MKRSKWTKILSWVFVVLYAISGFAFIGYLLHTIWL